MRVWRYISRFVLVAIVAAGSIQGITMAGDMTNKHSDQSSEVLAAKQKVFEFLQAEGEGRPRDEVFKQLIGPDTVDHPNLGEFYWYDGGL